MARLSLDPLVSRRVFVTGHTGFKGAWLSEYLRLLGADVCGYALPPSSSRGAYHDLRVADFAAEVTGDVRDFSAVASAMAAAAPDIVMHLAAQPLVRQSWRHTRETFEVNVMGTVNVLEAALATDSVAGVVVVTTDKVYENNEAGRPFVESDRLGGRDPYSASKAAAEIAAVPYRRGDLMGWRHIPVVSVRAGNVIGGGDWSVDRLVPDIIRALQAGENVVLRRPDAVRPWQHVLDCVRGYLLVAAAELAGRPLAPAYNFAHGVGGATVLEISRAVVKHWGASEDRIVIERETDAKEAGLLTLDTALAAADLGWTPAWELDESIRETVRFYLDPSVGRSQVEAHIARCDL